MWCAREDSNLRPLPPQGSALSPELRAHAMVPKVRLELTRARSPLRPERSASANSATSALSIPATCSLVDLTSWWAVLDSNQ
jgi:hypothetical protein